MSEKSRWDTADGLDSVAGTLAAQYPRLKQEMLRWSACENIWLRRAAIDFQQRYKEKTDTALLEQIIRNNLGTRAFFIDKAIGWNLREYGKADPKGGALSCAVPGRTVRAEREGSRQVPVRKRKNRGPASAGPPGFCWIGPTKTPTPRRFCAPFRSTGSGRCPSRGRPARTHARSPARSG